MTPSRFKFFLTLCSTGCYACIQGTSGPCEEGLDEDPGGFSKLEALKRWIYSTVGDSIPADLPPEMRNWIDNREMDRRRWLDNVRGKWGVPRKKMCAKQKRTEWVEITEHDEIFCAPALTL